MSPRVKFRNRWSSAPCVTKVRCAEVLTNVGDSMRAHPSTEIVAMGRWVTYCETVEIAPLAATQVMAAPERSAMRHAAGAVRAGDGCYTGAAR